MSSRCVVFIASAAIWAAIILASCHASEPPGKNLWLAVCAEQRTC